MNSNLPPVRTEIPEGFKPVLRDMVSKKASHQPGGCITWTGEMAQKTGYGRIDRQINGVRLVITAHRVSWILARGPISDPALVIDHLCRNRACINPDHMELVSRAENTRRGVIGPKPQRKPDPGAPDRLQCTNGHPWARNAILVARKDRSDQWACHQCRMDAGRNSYYRKQGRPVPPRKA